MGLRIGIVHWAFPPVIGGVEMHLLTIGPEMARQGADVSVLCGSHEDSPATEEIAGVSVERRDGMDLERIEEARAEGQDIYRTSQEMFANFLDEHALDVVQAHNLHYDFYPLSQALYDACRERDVPCYLVLHNDTFIDRSERVMLRILEEINWDKLVAVSAYIRDSLRDQTSGIPEDRWTVVMHGIDLEKFEPAGDERRTALKRQYGFGKRPMVLHPGRFLPWKGILPALHAMPAVVEGVPDALMVLTGRAERIYKDADELARYDAQIDDYIAEQHLGDAVHIGHYDHEDIPPLTTMSDVTIYTTIGQEPFGLVPVEGMAAGVPVIVTRSGGMVESVVDGETGFIIPRDPEALPEALSRHIRHLLTDPDLAAEMGRRGRRRAEERFDKERMARDFITLSQALVEAEA
jgi:glycosyltransferase involved in cell wall biosynthesis